MGRFLWKAKDEFKTAIASQDEESIVTSAGIYRQAVRQYREAVLNSSVIPGTLRRRLKNCDCCQKRCPGISLCFGYINQACQPRNP